MKNDESIEEWKVIARRDWKRVKRDTKEGDPVAAGFFLQQSIEKFLKAFLLERGWKLRKVHRLEMLLDEAVKHDPGLETFYDLCERLSGYYLADRYPPLGVPDILCSDIEDDMCEAERLIRTLFPGENLNV